MRSLLSQARPPRRAFSLVETLTAVIILGVVLAIGVPAIVSAKSKARDTQIAADLKTLNTFATQMRSAKMANPGSTGSDKIAALDFYVSKGFFVRDKAPNIESLDFREGVWVDARLSPPDPQPQ